MKSHAPTSAEREAFTESMFKLREAEPEYTEFMIWQAGRAAMQTASPDTRADFERHFAGATFQRNSDGHPCDYMDSATESLWIGYQAGRAMQTAEPVGSNPSCECGQTREWCKANDCPDLEPAIKSLAAPDRAPSIAPNDKCTLTDAELADPAFVRAYIEGCNDSCRQVMGEIKRLKAAPSIDSAADAIRAALNGYYEALSARHHGAIAQNNAFSKVERAMGMNWDGYKAGLAAIDALQPEGA